MLDYEPDQKINHPAVLLFLLENGLQPLPRNRIKTYTYGFEQLGLMSHNACCMLLAGETSSPEKYLKVRLDFGQPNNAGKGYYRTGEVAPLVTQYKQMYQQLKAETAAEQTRNDFSFCRLS